MQKSLKKQERQLLRRLSYMHQQMHISMYINVI